MRVVGGEGQRERGRIDPLVAVVPLLDRVREVVHLGVLRLLVQVLEQEDGALLLGVIDHALQPLEPASMRIGMSEVKW